MFELRGLPDGPASSRRVTGRIATSTVTEKYLNIVSGGAMLQKPSAKQMVNEIIQDPPALEKLA